MKKIVILSLALTALVACGGGLRPVDAPNAVSRYLNALASGDRDSLLENTCTNYESQALREFDSYEAVEVELDGVACFLADPEATGESLEVNCEGTMIVTYDYDQQRLDLSERHYIVEAHDDEWLVCGLTP